jgi:uncharacterized protein YxjI
MPFGSVESSGLVGLSLRLLAPDGDLLAAIESEAFSSTYLIHRADGLVATVKRKLALLRSRLEIDAGGTALVATGVGSEYTVTRDEMWIASISAPRHAWGDTYGLDVDAAEDPVLLLAIAVVIDCMFGNTT